MENYRFQPFDVDKIMGQTENPKEIVEVVPMPTIEVVPIEQEDVPMISGLNIPPIWYSRPDPNTMAHPNSPETWARVENEYQMKNNNFVSHDEMVRRASMLYRPKDIPIPPQVQQQRYVDAANYITGRGPVTFSNIDSPLMKSHRWNEEFKSNIEQKLNDPKKFSQPYYYPDWAEDRYNKYTGENVDEKMRLNNYYHIADQERMLYDDRKNRVATKVNQNTDQFKDINKLMKQTPGFNETRKEFNPRRDVKKNPGIPMEYLGCNPDGTNVIDSDGEPAFLLSACKNIQNKANELNYDERARIAAAIDKGYYRIPNQPQVQEDHPMDDNEEPVGYQQQGFYEHYNSPEYQAASRMAQQKYYPNYADRHPEYPQYMRQIGNWQPQMPWNSHQVPYYVNMADMYNAPSHKYTREELESGRIPFVITEKTKDIKIKEIEHDPIGYIDDIRTIKIGFSSYYIDEEGDQVYTKVKDPETKRMLSKEELDIKNKKIKELRKETEVYLDKKFKADQMIKDDSAIIATELSRYSEDAAELLLWYKANSTPQSYDVLKRAMLAQLIDYRNNDPFCMIKSRIAITNNRILVERNKNDVTEKDIAYCKEQEFERITKYMNSEKDDDPNTVAKNAFEQLDLIDHKSIKEQVEVLRNMINIHILPKKIEKWRAYKEQIFKTIPKMKKIQYEQYHMWRRLKKAVMNGIGAIAKFDAWWNKPYANQPESYHAAPVNQNTPFDYFMKLTFESPERERKIQEKINQSNQRWLDYVNTELKSAKTMEEYANATRRINNRIEMIKDSNVLRHRKKNLNYDNSRIGQILYAANIDPQQHPGFYSVYNRGNSVNEYEKESEIITNPAMYQDTRQVFLNRIFQTRKRGSLV